VAKSFSLAAGFSLQLDAMIGMQSFRSLLPLVLGFLLLLITASAPAPARRLREIERRPEITLLFTAGELARFDWHRTGSANCSAKTVAFSAT
jgi:hypothetical protein